MGSHHLTDKSLMLEAAFGGYALESGRGFAEPGVPPRYAPDRRYRIHRISLELWIDPDARNLRGRATLQVTALPGAAGILTLDLDELTVESVTDAGGSPLPWRHDDGRLRVRGVGEGGAVNVAYHGSPSRGLYFPGANAANPDRRVMAWSQCQDEDAHFIFPCHDHPSWKCPFDVTVLAPERFEVLSNGRLRSRSNPEAGWVRWSWVQADPITAYLFTVVVGEFEIVTAAGADVPVRYLAPQGTDRAVMERVFGKTPAMISFLSERYGVPYPWPRYDQVVVHDFIFGGMENAGATTLTDLVLTDDRAALDWNGEDLVVHELAHQWFGDLVTCQDWSQGWLNEGWATYSEHLWKRHDLGADEACYALLGQLQGYLSEDSSRYRRPIVTYEFRNPIDMFDRHLYEKGALVLHTLRGLLGEQAFWAGVSAYLRRHSHQTAHTRHFQRTMEDVTGRNLDAFFQQWVHGAGHPAITAAVAHEGDLLSVTITQTQEGDATAQAFHLDLPIRVVCGDQVQEIRLPVRERERAWAIPCPEAPDRVEVDSHLSVLAALKISASRGLLEASLRDDPGVAGRIRAAEALLKLGTAPARTALIAALSTEAFWGVRAKLASLLGSDGSAAARQALLDRLAAGEAHPKARRALVAALSKFRHEDAATALRGVAEHGDPAIQVEGEALRGLGKMRWEGAREICTAALERDSWGQTLRARALEGLGACREEAALPVLLSWTEDHRPVRARAAAVSALARLGDEIEACRRPAVDRLLELVADSPLRVRIASVSALGRLGDPRASGVLRGIHAGDPDGRTQRLAFEALRRISARKSGGPALAALKDELETLRKAAHRDRERLAKLERVSGD